MKLSVPQNQLIQPLQLVGGIVERRPDTPILANILLRVTPRGMSITGTDLEMEMITHINLDNAEQGEITLPARKMIDICRSLPEDSVVEIRVEGDRATVRSGRSRFTLATLPGAEFPGLDELKEPQELRLSREKLKQLIDKTSFSMAQQDVRYFLNGVCLEIHGNRLCAVATDGHRMSVCSMEIEQEIDEPRQIIIPRKAVLEISRLLSDQSEGSEVTLQIGQSHIKFLFPSLVFSAKLIDGSYPDYMHVIPLGNSNQLTADRQLLLQALRRTSILSTSDKIRSVRLELCSESDSMRIYAHNQEQEEAEEEIEVRYEGVDLEIGFNVSYLIDVLQVLEQEEVSISLGDSGGSCLITVPDEPGCRYVVMPMRL